MEKKLNGAGGEAVKVTFRADDDVDDETDDGVTGVDDGDDGDDES